MTSLQTTPFLRWPLAWTLALALSACGGDDPVKLLADAKASMGKQDLNTAVIQLKGVLQQQPASAEARFLLGQSLLAMGDKTGAELELQKALDAGYAAEQVAPLLAQALMDAGEYRRLEDKFAQIHLASPAAQADVLVVLARARQSQGKPDRAMAALDEALRLQPDHVPARLAKSLAFAVNHRFEEGMALLEQVLAQHPNSAEALKLKGDYLASWKQQPAEALKLYGQAVKAAPQQAEALAAIVRLHLNLQQTEEAQQALVPLRKLGENRPITLYLAAQTAAAQGKLSEARGFSQKLLRMAADNPWALEMAGIIEFDANALVQAEPYLARAVKADPSLRMARQMLVRTYLRTGQFDKAAAALPDKLDESQDPDILGLAGQVFQVQGNAARAQAMFIKAAQLAPDNASTQTSLALSKLAAGKDAEALGDLRGIAGRDKGVVADMALINALMQRGQFDKALEAIGKLEAKQPGDPMPKLIRAQALVGNSDEKGARQVLADAGKAAPKYFPVVNALVKLDARAGKLADAQKRVEAFLAQEPKHVDALLALAQVRQMQGAQPDELRALFTKTVEAAPDEPLPRLNLIRYQLFTKDNKAALAAAQSAVASLPANTAIQDALGQAQVAAGEYNQALSTYAKLAKLQPGSVGPHMRMAGVHMAAKQFDEAREVLRKALDQKPDSLELQGGLIDLAMQTQAVAEAISVTHAIQKQRPKEPVGYVMEGDVLVAANKYDEAAVAYQAARERAPQATDIALKLHELYRRAGKRAEADRFAEAWLAGHPKDLLFKGALADVALRDQNYPLAEKYFRQMNAAAPDTVEVLNNLSWVLLKQGNKEALTFAERALVLAPSHPDVLDTAASVLAAAGQTARAQELLRKAIALRPEQHAFKVSLARLQIQAQDKAGAKDTLRSLQKLGQGFDGQAEVTALLRGL